jgi:hypothetical protein
VADLLLQGQGNRFQNIKLVGKILTNRHLFKVAAIRTDQVIHFLFFLNHLVEFIYFQPGSMIATEFFTIFHGNFADF